MRISAILSFLFVTVPVTVHACEGDCIVAITNAFMGNYSLIVNSLFEDIASELSVMTPGHPAPSTAARYLGPMRQSYTTFAYNDMETTIFPNYFHGKCQQNGVDPAGCPNPDCPVVCGTPGSMVHFYPTLVELAFNATVAALELACKPNSEGAKHIELFVQDAVRDKSIRASRIYPRAGGIVKPAPVRVVTKPAVPADAVPTVPTSALPAAPVPAPSVASAHSHASGLDAFSLLSGGAGNEFLLPGLRRELVDRSVDSKLTMLRENIPNLLMNACGGSTLSKCSWEDAMKAFILTFP